MPKSIPGMGSKKSDLLRNQEHPTVLGYELNRQTLTPVRNFINTSKKGDYGADPVGNGKFKMVPSGDIVDYAERCKRLGQAQDELQPVPVKDEMAKAYFEKNSKKHGVKDVAGQWKSDGKGGWEYYVNSKYMGAAYQHAGQKPFAQTWEGQSANCATLEAAKAYVERYAVAKDELQPVPVGDALSDRQKLERRREIEAALAHSDSIGSRAEELAYRKSVSRSKETAAQGERLYKAIQAARAKLVVEYKELGGDVSRVSDEELKPVPVGKSDPERIKPSGPLGEFAAMKLRGEKIPAKDRRKQLHQALDRMLGKDTRSPQWQPDSPDKPLLNDLHKSLETLGHMYKYSGSGPDKGSIKHTYSEGANLVERKNGKHGIGFTKDSKAAKDGISVPSGYKLIQTLTNSKGRVIALVGEEIAGKYPDDAFSMTTDNGQWYGTKPDLDKRIQRMKELSYKSLKDELKPVPVNDEDKSGAQKALRRWQREEEAKMKAGEKERQARNAETLKKMREGKVRGMDGLELIPVGDVEYDVKQVDARRRKVFKEAERMYYAADPSASGFPYAPASVRKEWIDKAKKKLGLESIPAKDRHMRSGKDSLNKRELEDRLASVSQAFETACEGATAEEAQKAGATIKQAKNALKTNSSLQACSILVSAAYAQVNKMGKSGVGKDAVDLVAAYAKACNVDVEDMKKALRNDPLAKPQFEAWKNLSKAQSQEIAQDRKAALDSYRKAASAFRNVGDQKQEAIAREGIDECQRKLVGGVDSTYHHPSSGKVQAFDSADRALTSAIQRTRAGERVRMARDSATGETVVEPVK